MANVRETIIARIQAAGHDMFTACEEADRLIEEAQASPGTTIQVGIMGGAGKCADVIALRYAPLEPVKPKAGGKPEPGCMSETTRTLIRRSAVRLLNCDEGVSEDAWTCLRQLLEEAGHLDLIDQVEATDGRFYLPETARLSVEDYT